MFNEKKLPKKWLKILGLSVSLPSSIFAIVILFKILESKSIITKTLANILIIIFIIYFISLIVYYAIRKK